MMTPGTGVRVYLATRPCDMRKGLDGLAAQVQNVLAADPFSGSLFVFRGKRGDILKILAWDGSGLCVSWPWCLSKAGIGAKVRLVVGEGRHSAVCRRGSRDAAARCRRSASTSSKRRSQSVCQAATTRRAGRRPL